ncbi:MAG: OsmC family protein [Leptospiraceae bacterium]|nr:OsmC family protein [Leptospiraceae bacterium]
MKSEKITLENRSGHTLSVVIDYPLSSEPSAFILFAHCFTCNKNLTAIRNISRALTERNYAFVRFDFTGLGESGGEFPESNFSSNVEDIIDVASFLKANYAAPEVIAGHSLGGAAVLFAAGHIESVRAVVTIGSPAEPSHIEKHFSESVEQIQNKGCALVNIGGRPFEVQKHFIDDIRSKDLAQTVRDLKKPYLILHSPQDNIVSIENAAKLYSAAFHPKSFISLDTADHLLSDKSDSTFAGSIIASWVARYLDKNEQKERAAREHSEGQVTVRLGMAGFTTQIRAGQHSLTADEPEALGGKDLGPNPYDLLLASLGACTAMTLRMYADRKKWDLREINVVLDHKKDYQRDCEDCEKTEQKIDVIERKIKVEGDLSAEQRARILQIADMCPVHKTLHSQVVVKSELAES